MLLTTPTAEAANQPNGHSAFGSKGSGCALFPSNRWPGEA